MQHATSVIRPIKTVFSSKNTLLNCRFSNKSLYFDIIPKQFNKRKWYECFSMADLLNDKVLPLNKYLDIYT